MDLITFKQKYDEIKERGYIKSHRDGDTGVGHTFEQELGLEENNIAGPDIDGNELKTARKGAGGKQTLFAKEGDWVVPQRDYIETYGFPHTTKIGELSGQSTVTKTVNKRGLQIVTTDDYCAICHGNVIIVMWDWDTLINQFAKKFPACVKVFADVEKRDGVEYFHYNEAARYINVDPNRLRTAIENGDLQIDTRMYSDGILKSGKVGVRNRGTAFRINHDKLEKLFDKEIIN